MQRVCFVLTIILLTYFTVGKSLQFGLNGDDWGALYYYLTRFIDFQSYFDINNFSTALGNYTFAHIIMGIIYSLFSFNPFPYYLTSLILRIIAAISFYPAVSQATKSKLAGSLSAIFFAAMFTGIETTNWVFNMNTYISIAFLNLFLFFYFRSDHKVFSLTTFFLSLILFATFFSAPTRMHGILLLIPLIGLLKIQKLSKVQIKNTLITSVIFYLPILIFRFVTQTTEDSHYFENIPGILNHKVIAFINLLNSLGNTIIPEKLISKLLSVNSKAILVFCIYVLMTLLYIKLRKKYLLLTRFGLFSLYLPVIFLIIPWLINPNGFFASDHRYLLVPGAYSFVTLSILISIFWQQKNQLLKVMSIFFILMVLSVNIFSLRSYFSFLSNEGRLSEDVNKQFKFLQSQINSRNPDAPVALLIIPDDPYYLYNSITFGLTYHLMLTDSKFSLDVQKSPFPADNMDSLIDVLSGPQSKELLRYGYKPVQIPLENVFVFNLQNKNLTNITPEAKDFLKTKLPSLE